MREPAAAETAAFDRRQRRIHITNNLVPPVRGRWVPTYPGSPWGFFVREDEPASPPD